MSTLIACITKNAIKSINAENAHTPHIYTQTQTQTHTYRYTDDTLF